MLVNVFNLESIRPAKQEFLYCPTYRLVVKILYKMNKKAILIIFISAMIFGVIRSLFLKDFFLTNYLVKEISISLIEISIVFFLIKNFKQLQ